MNPTNPRSPTSKRSEPQYHPKTTEEKRRTLQTFSGGSQTHPATRPNNPHGEESEDVYFVDRSDLSEGTVVALREDREVWW